MHATLQHAGRGVYSVCVLIGLLLGFAVPAAPALAQFGMGMGANDAMELAIGREAVNGYADLLGFDEAQRETAMMLHQEYLDQYKSANDTFMDAMQKLQEEVARSGDWRDMMKPMGTIALGFFDRIESLEKTFFSDLQMLAFEPEQEEAFVRVERARRRERVGMAGQMSPIAGSTINLHEIARQVEVLGNDAAREALLAYEAEIDPVNKQLIETSFSAMRDQMERLKNMDEDDESMGFDAEAMEKMQEMMGKMRDLGMQSKGINARYARQVMQLLPAERQSAWDLEVKRQTWPSVYRASAAERQMDAAAELDSLTGEQRSSLEAIRQSYAREASAINERWSKAIDEQQANAQGGWWGFGGGDSEADEIEGERDALDERFVERVRSLLTAEQLEQMPEVSGSGFDADAILRQFGGG